MFIYKQIKINNFNIINIFILSYKILKQKKFNLLFNNINNNFNLFK